MSKQQFTTTASKLTSDLSYLRLAALDPREAFDSDDEYRMNADDEQCLAALYADAFTDDDYNS